MNNFIGALESVGGAKRCPMCCEADGSALYPCGVGKYIDPRNQDQICKHCHGTGQILDLAPLLAKPRCFLPMVSELIEKAEQWSVCGNVSLVGQIYEAPQPLYVVGPQRASNLVYEISRQLGGSAVVYGRDAAETKRQWEAGDFDPDGERLLGDIPPDATVLFVTDRFDEAEMASVTDSVNNPIRWLPYVLTLVSSKDVLHGPRGADELRVISLHQEKA